MTSERVPPPSDAIADPPARPEVPPAPGATPAPEATPGSPRARDATAHERACPGCGLAMPADGRAAYDGYYVTSPECWSVYTEVLAAEYGDMILFGRVHQLTVDAYAVQHAGPGHPAKSVGVHLCGLYLVLERGLAPPRVPPLLQRLATRIERWPALEPPPRIAAPTVLDVALARDAEVHAERVRAWAGAVWAGWRRHHATVRAWVDEHLSLAR